jgi:flagellar hook-associated protein 3 FlgL
MYRLGNLDKYQAKLNFQMGGSKLQFGSDDAVTFGRLTHTVDKMKTEIGVKNQLERVNVLNLASDVALKTTKQNIEYIKSELIKANTSTTTSEGLDAIAKNIEKMKQNLFDLANTQTEGQYLFSGSDASVKPFSMDSVTGKVTYNGNDKLRSVIVEDGSYRNAGVNGLETFYYTADSALKNNLQTFVNGDTLTDNSGNTFDLTLFTAPATDATPPIPTAPLAPEKYTVTKTNLDGATSPEEIYVRYNLAGDLETVIPNEVLNFKVDDRILDQDGNEWVLNIPTNDTLTKTN